MQPTPDPVSDEAGSRQVERGAAPTAETRIVPATGSAGRLKLAGSRPSASETIRWKSGHITPDPTKLSAFFILGGIPMVVTGRKHSV
jgi:hypothetical protein